MSVRSWVRGTEEGHTIDSVARRVETGCGGCLSAYFRAPRREGERGAVFGLRSWALDLHFWLLGDRGTIIDIDYR